MKLAAIVLAGGKSGRFGQAKVLAPHPISAEDTFVSYIAKQVFPLVDQLVIVGGAFYSDLVQSDVLASYSVIPADAWHLGLAESLKTGVSEVTQDPTVSHIMPVLADQVLITQSSLQPLVEFSHQFPDRVIVSHYGQSLGAPAIFPIAFRDKLMALEGDSGAGKVIKALAHSKPEMLIKVAHPEAEIDVDTPELWQQLHNS